MYASFASCLTHIIPLLEYEIFGLQCLSLLFVNASNYGLLGMDIDEMLLESHCQSTPEMFKEESTRSTQFC